MWGRLSDRRDENELHHRFNIFGLIILLIFVLLMSRLGYLQVAHGRYYRHLAESNRIRLIPIMAPRGTIYDRNGIPLVDNRPGFMVSLVPVSGPIADGVIDKLAAILGMSPAEVRAKAGKHGDPFEPVWIKRNLGQDVVAKIEEHKDELPGVEIGVQPVRSYIYNELGAHIFGYVGEISEAELKQRKADGYKIGDIVGKSGLEEVYDKDIRGIDGGEQVEVDVAGRPVEVLGKKEPVPGNSLQLTIDSRVQRAAEEAIDEQLKYLQTKLGNVNAKAAAAVVMNPKTGAILAMASRPAFNPNLFNGGISVKDWKAINDNPFDPMENRAIDGEYPPGSTFKIVTSTAALELGKLTPEEKIFDSGHYLSKGNALGEALGWIDFKTALAKSDNVFFYQMGERVGIDNLAAYARMYGLGARTGINLPDEASGLVASREYKEKVYHEDWYLSETLDAAIGQGFQLTTPLQIAMLMEEVANGGHRYRPYLVSGIVSPDGKPVKTFTPEEVGTVKVSESTLNLIRDALHEVALPGGTAAYAFNGFPVSVAGKTGTAENPHGDDHGWFVGYAPFDDPQVVVAVVVEQGGFGSDSAAPIARKILEAVFNVNQPSTSDAKVDKPGAALSAH